MKSVEFDPDAFEDLVWWIERDRGTVLRIVKLVRDIQRDPPTGIGKPERLKHELAGCWSRRIDQEHRIVYQVKDDRIPHPLLPTSLLIAPVGYDRSSLIQFSRRTAEWRRHTRSPRPAWPTLRGKWFSPGPDAAKRRAVRKELVLTNPPRLSILPECLASSSSSKSG